MLMWQSGRILSLQFLLLSPIKQLTDPFITHLSDKERNPGRQICLDGWCASMVNRKHHQNVNKICQPRWTCFISTSVGAGKRYLGNFSVKSLLPPQNQVSVSALRYGNGKRASKPRIVTPPFLEGDNGNKQQTQGCWWLVLSNPRGGGVLPAGVTCRHSCVVTCATWQRRMSQDLPASKAPGQASYGHMRMA